MSAPFFSLLESYHFALIYDLTFESFRVSNRHGFMSQIKKAVLFYHSTALSVKSVVFRRVLYSTIGYLATYCLNNCDNYTSCRIICQYVTSIIAQNS